MPLPASVPVGTVTGRYYEPDGDNATGTAYFLLLSEIEVPDDADGVVIPLMTKTSITGGVLNVTLPAGFYNTRVRLGDWYEKSLVIEVESGVALNLPDAVGVVPPEELLTPVRSVNGVLPDASGNIEVSGGGGGAVSSVFGRTGAVVAQSGDYTKAQVGLSNVDNTSDLAKPISTATQTALDTKEANGTAASAVSAHVAAADPHTQYALESSLAPVATSGVYGDLTGKPTIPTPVKAFGTTGKITGTFGPGDTSGSWTVAPAQWRVTVPASVGDVLCLDPSIIAQVGADAEMDVCSLNGNTPLRYYSSGTSTQGANGHGGLYMGTQYNRKVGSIKWVVTADDIVGGNVTLSYMYRAGSGITWGSGAYPNEITLINEGSP
jgi:hypothetical protein